MWDYLISITSEAIASAFYTALDGIINMFPIAITGTEELEPITNIVELMYGFNFIFPVATMLEVLGVIVVFEIMYLMIKLGIFIMRLIATAI